MLGKSAYRFCGWLVTGVPVITAASNMPGNGRSLLFIFINAYNYVMCCLPGSARAVEHSGNEVGDGGLRFMSCYHKLLRVF